MGNPVIKRSFQNRRQAFGKFSVDINGFFWQFHCTWIQNLSEIVWVCNTTIKNEKLDHTFMDWALYNIEFTWYPCENEDGLTTPVNKDGSSWPVKALWAGNKLLAPAVCNFGIKCSQTDMAWRRGWLAICETESVKKVAESGKLHFSAVFIRDQIKLYNFWVSDQLLLPIFFDLEMRLASARS